MAAQDAPVDREQDGAAAARGDEGKGKENETSSPGTSEDHGKDNSLISRVAKSTVGLATSMLSGAPSSSILASAVAGKGSTSASAATAPSEPTSHQAQASARSQPDIAAPGQQFRASQAHIHASAEEAAFSDFLDSTPVVQPSGSSQMDDATWHMASMEGTGDSTSDHAATAYSSVAEQERHDGEAVVSILTDASEHLPDSLLDDMLSPEEQENLRRALFGPSTGEDRGEVDWNHVLNFIPEYLRHEEPQVDAYMDTGLLDPAEAWDTWVGQWKDVLTRYQDEVWGDLATVVRQARQEVDELAQVQKDELPHETPALRRLRGILGHLRG
jgi:hypothetical protein